MEKDIELTDRIWTVNHLKKYLMVSEKTAYSEIKQAIAQELFTVRKVGKQYRIARDTALNYYEGRC